MKPQGTQSLLGNIFVVVGGTATDRDDPLLMDFFVLLVKFEETKRTQEFRERSILEVDFEITSKQNIFLLCYKEYITNRQRIFSFVKVRKPYHHLYDNLTIVSNI